MLSNVLGLQSYLQSARCKAATQKAVLFAMRDRMQQAIIFFQVQRLTARKHKLLRTMSIVATMTKIGASDR